MALPRPSPYSCSFARTTFSPRSINGKSLLLSFKRPETLLISNFGHYLYLLQRFRVGTFTGTSETASLLRNRYHFFHARNHPRPCHSRSSPEDCRKKGERLYLEALSAYSNRDVFIAAISNRKDFPWRASVLTNRSFNDDNATKLRVILGSPPK